MEILTLLTGLASSETAVFAIFLILGLVYKEVIKPKLDRLKKYEEGMDDKLKNLLTKDELIKMREHSHNEMADEIVNRVKDNLTHVKEEIDEIQTKVEDAKSIIKGAIRDDIHKVKSMIESMQINFSEHDKRLDYNEQDMEIVKRNCINIYKLMDSLTISLETKNLIDKVVRPSTTELDNGMGNLNEEQFRQLMERFTPRSSRRTKSLRIDRISREEE